MSEHIKGVRLAKVAKEINLNIEAIAKYLREKGFEVDVNPTTKLTLEMYSMILKDFNAIEKIEQVIGKIDLNEKAKVKNTDHKRIVPKIEVPISNDKYRQRRIPRKNRSVNIESLNLLNDKLNDKQKEAILGALNAKDFYLIQGPPGTGKSTAISEITWQHIYQNKEINEYKILVTSETNLAVDNALTKLISPYHNLIKPIRFGKNIKLDKEGRQFSFETFDNWLNNNNDEDTKKCSLQKWKSRIIKYAGQTEQSPKINDLIGKWKKLLSQSQKKDNQKFHDTYINNVNVIGSTCSSIGKVKSIKGFTSFFWNYLKLFNTKNYNQFQIAQTLNDEVQIRKIYRMFHEIKIEFDLVIQDESSKASPAELALPLVYARKAIVIGDHRQLPPMLNNNEFIDDLKVLKSKVDRSNNRNIDRLIDVIKNNPKDFEISQFEKIYHHLADDMKTSFNEQYRMHPDINEAVKQFYIKDNGLECGIPEKLLNLDDITHPASRMHHLEIENIINSNNHIIWINCDTPEVKLGTSRCNIGEINVIKKILVKLENSDSYKRYLDKWQEIEEKQIGIISFYGAQLKLLHEIKADFPSIPMRISTVDKFQGMERNILIVSTVRSNKIAPSINQYDRFKTQQDLGLGFAEVPNRLNVALSRAKKLLIIVGNKGHFKQKEIYTNLVNVIESLPNGLILESTEV